VAFWKMCKMGIKIPWKMCKMYVILYWKMWGDGEIARADERLCSYLCRPLWWYGERNRDEIFRAYW